jgi:hypothetical protein
MARAGDVIENPVTGEQILFRETAQGAGPGTREGSRRAGGDARWERIGAAGGIAFVLLQVAAQALIQVGGAEPAFDAPAAAAAAFFATRDGGLFTVGDYLSTLSLVPFVWFLGRLWGALRRGEGEPGWLSLVALASGLLFAAAAGAGGDWALAVFRRDEGLDPQLARLLFDQGNLAFANAWVMLGSLCLATGVVAIRTRALPRGLGWAGVALAAGLLAARAGWASSGLVFVPYVLFWLWLLTISVVLLRRAGEA